MKQNKKAVKTAALAILFLGTLAFSASQASAYHNSDYEDWDEGPYVYDRGREIDRNLRQMPRQSPVRYDREKEIKRNLRQMPRYYYDHDYYYGYDHNGQNNDHHGNSYYDHDDRYDNDYYDYRDASCREKKRYLRDYNIIF